MKTQRTGNEVSKMQNMQLNPYQQEAVLDESNACLVNANVGSGKI